MKYIPVALLAGFMGGYLVGLQNFNSDKLDAVTEWQAVWLLENCREKCDSQMVIRSAGEAFDHFNDREE